MTRFVRGWVLAAALTAVLTPAVSWAQAPEQAARPAQVTVCELVLRDGSRIYGTIEREDDTQVVFRTLAGATITAARADIHSLHKVTGVMAAGEFQRSDPNSTRLFFGPTGRALPKGHAYLGVYEFMMPFVQVGVTDRFSIGAGTPLVFGFDEGDRPFWITPKLQVFNGQTTQVAVGLLHGANLDGDGGGIAYAVGTHGNAVGSFTLGAGMAYANDGGRAGVVMVGGERSLRRNMKLLTENYIWEGGSGVVSAGVRFFGERLSADLGIGVPIGTDSFFAFPVVNFVYVF